MTPKELKALMTHLLSENNPKSVIHQLMLVAQERAHEWDKEGDYEMANGWLDAALFLMKVRRAIPEDY